MVCVAGFATVVCQRNTPSCERSIATTRHLCYYTVISDRNTNPSHRQTGAPCHWLPAIAVKRIHRHTPTTTNARPRRGGGQVVRFVGRLFLAAVKVGGMLLVAVLAAGGWLIWTYGHNLPDVTTLNQHRPAEPARLYARDGTTLLAELAGPRGDNRTIVPLPRIPPIVQQATIAVEDAHFYQHPGFDPWGMARAVYLNAQQGDIVSGGSTITQQLVRQVLLPPDPPGATTRQRYERKIREVLLAFQVSQHFSKDQILQLYLNEVYYGQQAYGIEAAAQTYFGKHVWHLNAGEATLLAGLPQSPTLTNPRRDMAQARARQRVTLNLMVKQGLLTASEADIIYSIPIQLAPPPPPTTPISHPHFVFFVRDMLEQHLGPDRLYRDGLDIVTTLDPVLQADAEQIASQRISELHTRNAFNCGAVILSSDVQLLAMVGSADYNDATIAGKVNTTLAPRQPGSALKPIIYAAALERGWTPDTPIVDEPTTFNSNGVPYTPRNYTGTWHGEQTVRMALANSLNIPAVKALEFVGVAAFVETATQMGITTFADPQRHGLHMALGSNEVRLLDLTTAYATLQNAGLYRPPTAVLAVRERRGRVRSRWYPMAGTPVFGDRSRAVAADITRILSDNAARRMLFGAGNVMELPDGRPAAVKTGTSNDWRDSWAVGYTPSATIGVWVGNSDATPMQEIAGANGAGLVWRDLMLRYHGDTPPQPLP